MGDEPATAWPGQLSETGGDHDIGENRDSSVEVLGLVSLVMSGLGFLTLLKLADRRDRSPARALGLFVATSFETVGGTVTGLMAASRASGAARPGRGLVLGASGAILGVITTVWNISWMRTKRRL